MKSKFQIAKEILGNMSLGERLLLAVSKHPDQVDNVGSYEEPSDRWTLENALDSLIRAFPSLADLIRGKDVLDYGCGDGFQSVAMRRLGANYILGVDIEQNRLTHAKQIARNMQNVEFRGYINNKFDIIVSLNAMEHYTDPMQNITEIKDGMKEKGLILMSFGPPWCAPYGHHMYFFCSLPWINLLFSERTVFRIRSLYRSDGADSYDPGLNRMTIAKFEKIIRISELKIEYKKYNCVKGLNALGMIPVVREFFVNQVDVILKK